MKIGHVSDLHVDHGWRFDIIDCLIDEVNKSDINVLVIAGDITSGGVARSTLDLLRIRRGIKVPVVFVAGNHEFYDTDFQVEQSLLDSEYLLDLFRGGIYWLENSRVVIGDVLFVGGTGWIDGSWHNIHKEKEWHPEINRLNDFRLIQNYDQTLKHGQELRELIENTNSLEVDNMVVVTHYMPLKRLIHPGYYNDGPLNWCFANNWTDTFDRLPVGTDWICGHSHNRSDVVEYEGVSIRQNPLGYPNENPFRQNIIECFEV